MRRQASFLLFSAVLLCASAAIAFSNDELKATLSQRFEGDQTGACIAAPVIDDGGGVRATLPDMLRYLEGELGARDSAITPALARTQDRVVSVGGHRMGMNWSLLSVNGHTLSSNLLDSSRSPASIASSARRVSSRRPIPD
ncbi:MAG TPA: hypothetical protein VGH70_08065 [Bradyrhizobium sp.]